MEPYPRPFDSLAIHSDFQSHFRVASGSLLGARPLTLYPQIEVFTAQRFSSIRSGETLYYPIL